LPTTAISNCFPGLEFDLRNAWRKIFVEVEMHENYLFVVASTQADLRGRQLVRYRIGDRTVSIVGQDIFGTDEAPEFRDSFVFEAWNSLIELVPLGGQTVNCDFDDGNGNVISRNLTVRNLFAPGTAAIAQDVAEPGELTQSLCSPWQNDYKECGCYYWAASRPDYVNVQAGPNGASIGHNWMQPHSATTPKTYFLDIRDEAQLITYDALFRDWQRQLRFVIGGND
jgi:hypothetical protein